VASGQDLEALIARINAGDDNARSEAFASAYDELKRLARARLWQDGGSTSLNPTALVHESYLRLVNGQGLIGDSQRAYFAYASQVMRSVIIDTVRERQALRRGGDLQQVTLNTELADAMPVGEEGILDVDAALKTLAQTEPRLAAVVEMRYFSGYTEAQVAEALDLNERTVRRDWLKAKLLLSALLRA
jgi:RNA polymerase sigma factor (TIGR02999 family)